jgi:FixJ family two-component response regulator
VTNEYRIAVVDDDQSVREAALNLFRSMGFPAQAFASAEEFLRSGSVEQTSCLVLDVQMPGMGGLKLQSELEATGRHIPIVFITGYHDEGVRTKALDSGAIVFLTKPFTEDDLLDGLRTALKPGEHIEK